MEEDREFSMEVECFHCGTLNYVHVEPFSPTEEIYAETVDCEGLFGEATDFIFGELVKDGFAPNSSAIRQVIRYFSDFCEQKAIEMFGPKHD